MSDRPASARLTPASAREIKRLINVALDGVEPGCEVEVEAGGIRVRVKRDAPGGIAPASNDDEALNKVRRSLGVAGPV